MPEIIQQERVGFWRGFYVTHGRMPREKRPMSPAEIAGYSLGVRFAHGENVRPASVKRLEAESARKRMEGVT